MRPIDKGAAPYQQINVYTEALPYLEEKIGCYCSYCELKIEHVPEVEHCYSKDRGGSPTDWDNLLLGCKYCNSRKKTIIGDHPKSRWLWPDEDNTFLAFKYDDGIPKLNEAYLSAIGQTVYEQAKSMFNDLKLDNIPHSPSDKDRRYKNRLDAYNRAKEIFISWNKAKGTFLEEDFKNTICNMATAMGFFSVWMAIFKNEPIICVALIHSFSGTALNCFDANGLAVPRPNGKI